MKDEFVGLVSHELRTPLTSIIGYLEMVLEENAEPLTTSQRQFLATVNRNVERLATLVNELLFLAQVDAGRLELTSPKPTSTQLLAEATEAAQPAANAKQIELTLEAGRARAGRLRSGADRAAGRQPRLERGQVHAGGRTRRR